MGLLTKIKKIVGAVVHAPGRFDDLAGRIASVNDRITGVERGLQEQLNRLTLDFYLEQMYSDQTKINRLSRQLSITPVIWGDPERLEIDETAKVFTCFFNTNSGRIRIGESTFAGSGVSLLAGSHDPNLTGNLRRDAEIKEGCDIEIGKGVWLASGCTILGPCRIGDNAVIAAGALVTPGTEVQAGTLWGGVPARQIRKLDLQAAGPENPAVRAAYARSEGILFAEGWGERIPGILEIPGHWLCKEEGKILTEKADWLLAYQREGTGKTGLRVSGPAGETEVVLNESEGRKRVHLPITEGELGVVRITRGRDERIFFALMPLEGVWDAEEDEEEEAELDMEAIMKEIREEARRHIGREEDPGF